MQDRPTATELLEALASFLGEELAGKVEGGLRFKVLVAANVAGIVARELRLGHDQDRAQLSRLAALRKATADPEDASSGPEDAPSDPAHAPSDPAGGDDTAARVRALSEELCRRIDAGEADDGPFRAAVLAHLKACVDEKLAVDNPARLVTPGNRTH